MQTKENQLLQELMDAEDLCAEKYTRAASDAGDPQLKNLFSSIAQEERGHYDTLDSVKKGTVPPAGGKPSVPTAFKKAEKSGRDDEFLCRDLLAAEKHASHLYDTCLFEFTSQETRNQLNHIQKEEQEHGKRLYDYMKVNGWY